ncbi:unnamed protein product [Camellia sinensis]
MAAFDKREEAQEQEKTIPVFTVLKNNTILKNIFLLDNLPSVPDLKPFNPLKNSDRVQEFEETLLVGRHPDCNIIVRICKKNKIKMKLTPREVEKLMLHDAGYLAQKRLARGLRLNYTEAVALIATQILEFVRDGEKTVAELMDIGKQLLGRYTDMENTGSESSTLSTGNKFFQLFHTFCILFRVEGTFPDGTKLITIHDAIASENGNLELALDGSFLPVPSLDKFLLIVDDRIPGELRYGAGCITLNHGRKAVTLKVTSTGDRPIQDLAVGSHYHFIEVNPFLVFDRSKAHGMRLNIPAGTATRFEPGDKKSVTLVRIGGKQVIRGGNNIADGPVDDANVTSVMKAVRTREFRHSEEPNASEGVITEGGSFTYTISREAYANMYGPTVGDKVRLGDTDLFAEIEKDFAVYGDECVFGGGKVIRDGMGQASGYPAADCLDTVITNALIIDYTGIFKADIGIKGSVIVAIGKAGNPDVMDGVSDNMIIGVSTLSHRSDNGGGMITHQVNTNASLYFDQVNTEVIAGEGMIVTAGAIDCHVHFICPQLAYEAISSGITTLVGGGTGPADGTRATTCTPAASHMKLMLQSTDDLPLNFGFTGKGNGAKPEGLHEIIKAGAMGLKLHEDWGTTPAVIDNSLTVAEQYDVQVNIHTDTLNESGFVEHTIAAFKDRTIHAYHSEGAGGGHAPDIIKVCGVKNVLPSSTNPTRPFTSNTIDEHLDMLMVCHHLDKDIPEDVAFAESRIRAETIAAEDILHDMGAISIISSDSQAMGRIGEVTIFNFLPAAFLTSGPLHKYSSYQVVNRTWQTAHKMKLLRGSIESSGSDNDNLRIKRYVAKYTINPAIANGFSEFVGSVEAGKLADLVIWKPSFFGAKPEMVIKGGTIAWANMGDPNASIPTPEPHDLEDEEVDNSLISVVRRILAAPKTEKEDWRRTSIFQMLVRCGNQARKLIIDGGSSMNVVSATTVERLKLPVQPHPHPYKVAWIDNTSIPHSGKENTYAFSFKNKEIVLKPMTTAEMGKFKEKKPRDVTENKPKSLHILTKKCFQAESMELGVIYAVVVKEVSDLAAESVSELPTEVAKLLSHFSDVAPKELPDELPPMRNVQHAIDLIPGSQLPNLPAYRMNPREHTKLKRQVDELLSKGFIRESLSPCAVIMRPMFGAFGKAGSSNSIAFVSKVAIENEIKALYGLNKRVEAVGNVRKLTKLDMKLNDALPNIKVDPETYTVTADDVVLTCTAATTVPLSRNYFLF